VIEVVARLKPCPFKEHHDSGEKICPGNRRMKDASSNTEADYSNTEADDSHTNCIRQVSVPRSKAMVTRTFLLG